MRSSFGETVRAARLALRLKQADVLVRIRKLDEKVKISQAQFSMWETGKSKPESTSPIVAILAQALEIEVEVLRISLNSDSGSESSAETQKFLQSLGYKATLTVLGPAALRLADPSDAGNQARERWAEYLKNGLEIEFVWLCDMVDSAGLRNLATSIAKLKKSMDADVAGCMTHYAVYLDAFNSDKELSPYDARLSENLAVYAELEQLASRWNCVVSPARIGLKLWRDLMLFWSGVASVCAIVPKNFSEQPQAIIVVRDALRARDDLHAAAQVSWLQRAQVHELLAIFERLRRWLSENSAAAVTTVVPSPLNAAAGGQKRTKKFPASTGGAG